jgi:hypothetical protein
MTLHFVPIKKHQKRHPGQSKERLREMAERSLQTRREKAEVKRSLPPPDPADDPSQGGTPLRKINARERH